MNPTFLVLTNVSPAAEKAASWAAALGTPLRARLSLLHVYHDAVLDLELATATAPAAFGSPGNTRRALQELASRLPAPAALEVSVESITEALAEAIHRDHPLLLAMGLSPEYDLIDHLLHNQALPALRATHRPLLLVPEQAPAPRLPRQVLFAVDGEPFTLNAAAKRLAPLLSSWPAAYTVVNVSSQNSQLSRPGRMGLADVRACGVVPDGALALREENDVFPATGILHAADETGADLLVLIVRSRSFLGRLFHHSITAQVLRRCRIPVLLLPAEAADPA